MQEVSPKQKANTCFTDLSQNLLSLVYKSFSPHCLSKYLTMSEFTESFVSDYIGQQLCFGLIKSPVFAVDLFSGLSDLPDEW